MYTYDLLENGCYYLVREAEDSPISLIKVAVETDHCLFVQRFDDPTQTEWKLKSDVLADIIECLSDEAVKAWEAHYSSEDVYEEDDDD
ncbi:MAG: hypothetical protein J0H92_13375 [Sphingobacteriales bacterium]|jgi:hypothetical protein|nr:hypothetical protein [Chitinophagaceae bacterium]MBN8864358.1 hypothetical protein [Sphingobacteriales bacterium]NCT73118.1 hypothetical protein [Chitinophagaceae bacterium]OJW37304.1 MAG: hypothetical protein BGO54_11880 [Sphingobacteriales bacterium 46-32]